MKVHHPPDQNNWAICPVVSCRGSLVGAFPRQRELVIRYQFDLHPLGSRIVRCWRVVSSSVDHVNDEMSAG